MSRFYITTPIYYVNDHPHIGHIYTTLVADVVARFRRGKGEQVYFLTGTDEHGQNIERAAEKRGIQPLELADEVVSRYHSLWQAFGISHDDFIRTTEERHRLGVEEMIRRIDAKGDFYTSHHEGWYCSSCEAFYTDKELQPGELCPVHERPVERREEENIFFRLSKYQDALLAWYESDAGCVQPESRLNEVRQFVASGLRDLSVSRSQLDWGIAFPGHPGQTVYVWLDALTNYLSALGFGRPEASELYDQYWQGDGARVHLVGKDILRFHAVYWPAFLMSAGLPLPTQVVAHGWWLRDQQKISKSVGNVVRPDELVAAFGIDSLRYFLLRDMVFGQDASFSDEGFIDRYNSDLANDLGNTVSRLVTLSRRAFDGQLPPTSCEALRQSAEEHLVAYHQHMEAYAFQRALESLWKILAEANQYLVANEPWKKLKEPDALPQVAEVLWCGLEAVRLVAAALVPLLPQKAPEVLRALGFADGEGMALEWGGLPTGIELPAVSPIFPRIDKKAYLAGAEAAAPQTGAPQTATPSSKKKETALQDKTPAATPETAATDTPAAAPTAAAPTAAELAPTIDIEQFFATELRVATIEAAEAVPKSNKLLKLTVEIGEPEKRTVVAGIAKAYAPEELVGKQVVVVANLKPAKLMGVESNGMVLAASEGGQPVLLHPQHPVAPGTKVR